MTRQCVLSVQKGRRLLHPPPLVRYFRETSDAYARLDVLRTDRRTGSVVCDKQTDPDTDLTCDDDHVNITVYHVRDEMPYKYGILRRLSLGQS